MPHRMDDDFLLRFLRARNFNVNRAHRLVSIYINPLYFIKPKKTDIIVVNCQFVFIHHKLFNLDDT